MSVVLITEPVSGGGGGSGTVTSVDVVGGTTGLTTSGGPVTTAGVITLAGILAVANGGTGTATPGLVAGTNVTITGTWPNQTINASGGGGGTPGGSNTQIQFNNSGAFGGSANFTWDGTNVQLGTQGALRFADADSSNYVAFKAPTTIGTNVTWTLPSIDGAYAQVLSTNGSGTLSWITQSGGGSGSPNLDGGTPTSNYGGITAIDGGVP
jgi:hypothetical protein